MTYLLIFLFGSITQLKHIKCITFFFLTLKFSLPGLSRFILNSFCELIPKLSLILPFSVLYNNCIMAFDCMSQLVVPLTLSGFAHASAVSFLGSRSRADSTGLTATCCPSSTSLQQANSGILPWCRQEHMSKQQDK